MTKMRVTVTQVKEIELVPDHHKEVNGRPPTDDEMFAQEVEYVEHGEMDFELLMEDGKQTVLYELLNEGAVVKSVEV